MSTPYQGYEPPRRTRPLHLLWAVPLSLLGGYVAVGFAGFAWCGLHACNWDDRGSSVLVGAFTLLAGIILAAPWWFVPWTSRPRWRVIIGLTLCTVVWIGGWYGVTHQLL
ncbi:hypothetical protein CSO01_38240 [Cellulomonas soli]|uniref:Transmembrane protein n=1 Tax=Cellulomonas soli TaxID=931535 RepID=A0A512PIS3_9CELL|nr:hypothetical protein CSO01_38240 [Cellulomonas soli]